VYIRDEGVEIPIEVVAVEVALAVREDLVPVMFGDRILTEEIPCTPNEEHLVIREVEQPAREQ
jgi:hypothetical protein